MLLQKYMYISNTDSHELNVKCPVKIVHVAELTFILILPLYHS